MQANDKIDMDIFKTVNRAIAESDQLDIMAASLAQLLTGVLGLKGSTIFVLNPETGELEMLASFGMSMTYLNKGPVLFKKSIGSRSGKEPIVIGDVSGSSLLQYPDAAKEEGVAAIISLPIMFKGKTVGALRLYHSEIWSISDADVDSLMVLAENIGLAITYTRLANALSAIKETAGSVHDIWLE